MHLFHSCNISVVGPSGNGKSMLINALTLRSRGEAGSAKSGSMETTIQRTSYKHKIFHNVTFWDCVGMYDANKNKQAI